MYKLVGTQKLGKGQSKMGNDFPNKQGDLADGDFADGAGKNIDTPNVFPEGTVGAQGGTKPLDREYPTKHSGNPDVDSKFKGTNEFTMNWNK